MIDRIRRPLSLVLIGAFALAIIGSGLVVVGAQVTITACINTYNGSGTAFVQGLYDQKTGAYTAEDHSASIKTFASGSYFQYQATSVDQFGHTHIYYGNTVFFTQSYQSLGYSQTNAPGPTALRTTVWDQYYGQGATARTSGNAAYPICPYNAPIAP